MTNALFVTDPAQPNWVLPTEFSRGPWDPQHLHGGPVAAIGVRAAEQLVRDTVPGTMQLARVTVELERPVPLAPLMVEASLGRPGRKVAGVDVVISLAENGSRLGRARMLFIRRETVDLGEGPQVTRSAPPAPPNDLVAARSSWEGTEVAFHLDGAEHRFVESSWIAPAPAVVWIRLRVPVVADETPSGAQRAVAAADFANGVSFVIPSDQFLFLNGDLTVHLLEEPVGEWIALQAATHYGATGLAFSDTALFDRNGRIGRSNQSLLVERRVTSINP